jgi:tetratricopeptide (TPR) repeat protein
MVCRMLVVGLLVGCISSTVFARFAAPQLESVPIDRLVANMEKMVAEKPKDGRLRYNLARVHAMAYASKNDKVSVNRGREANGAWFGFTPKFVPFGDVQKTADADAGKKAKEHLAKAIACYEQATELDENHLAAQLGLAWCIDQSGDKPAAIKAYRNVLEAGWAKESKGRGGPLGGNYITVEASGYLKQLLDAEKDKDEIATIDERSQELRRRRRPVTPIVVPLKNSLAASDIIDQKASVGFDLDGTQLDQRWMWIKPNAAWLVYDLHGRGQITSGLQLFGSVTFWCFWQHGYEPLAALDDDGDGRLAGQELAHLALWHDANSNGVSDAGEVRSLVAHGIVSLSCRAQLDGKPHCVAHAPAGVTFRDGSTRPTYDVVLEQAGR